MNSLILKIKNFLINLKTKIISYRFIGSSLLYKILFGTGLVLIFIFPITAFVSHTISDEMNFKSKKQPTTVVVTDVIDLINREVVENGWIANKPFFFPQALLLDNMPNYQNGIIYGLQKTVTALANYSNRNDLRYAANALATKGDKWGFGKNSATRQYIEARDLLQEGGMEITMDELLFSDLVEEAYYGIENRFRQSVIFLNSSSLFKTDNEFYFNKGMLYSFYIVLRDGYNELKLKREDSDLDARVNVLLKAMERAINYDPMIIFSFSNTPSILSNHILTQNYYMSEIMLALKDISNRR